MVRRHKYLKFHDTGTAFQLESDSGFRLEVIAVYLKKWMNISTHNFATHTVLDNLPMIFICACLSVCQSVCLSVYSPFISLSLSLSLSVDHFFHVLPLGPKMPH